MTKRERVYSAIKHKTTDIIPYHLSFTSHGYQNLATYFNDQDIINKIGNHIHVQWYNGACNGPGALAEIPQEGDVQNV